MGAAMGVGVGVGGALSLGGDARAVQLLEASVSQAVIQLVRSACLLDEKRSSLKLLEAPVSYAAPVSYPARHSTPQHCITPLVSPSTKSIIHLVPPACTAPAPPRPPPPSLPRIVTRQEAGGHTEYSRACGAGHTEICVPRARRHAAKPPPAPQPPAPQPPAPAAAKHW